MFKKIFFTLIGLTIVCGIAYGVALYFNKEADDFPAHEMANVKLEEELLRFTYAKLPEVYQGFIDINNEMLIIAKELERLKTIENRFPKQKKIIAEEEKNLNRMQAILSNKLADFENTIEAMFVAFSVNIEKGTQKIEEEKTDLKASIDEVLTTSTEVTQRLKNRPQEKKSFVDNLLAKIGLGAK